MNKIEIFMDVLMPAVPAIGIMITLVWIGSQIT
jgi:hypothetical protein